MNPLRGPHFHRSNGTDSLNLDQVSRLFLVQRENLLPKLLLFSLSVRVLDSSQRVTSHFYTVYFLSEGTIEHPSGSRLIP